MDKRPLVFGPAYVDVVIEIDRPLAAPRLIDRSQPAERMEPRDDEQVLLTGNDDTVRIMLPHEAAASAETYFLSEPICDLPLTAEFTARTCTRELGGMGAGYAKALHGMLRVPIGGSTEAPDAVGREALALLRQHGVDAMPVFLPDVASDASLIILSPQGDKLAVGVRQAMVRWQVQEEDVRLAASASALVFCGAPNVLMAAVLAQAPGIPVMCAPALRNTRDTAVPLATLAEQLHYLTLNTLEWAHIDGREHLMQHVPVITVTDGPCGSTIYFKGEMLHVPAVPHPGPTDVNRAGETFGATFFSTLLREASQFMSEGITADLAMRTGLRAAMQAERQLSLRGFAFPEEER